MPISLRQILCTVGLVAVFLLLNHYFDFKIIVLVCLAFIITKHI